MFSTCTACNLCTVVQKSRVRTNIAWCPVARAEPGFADRLAYVRWLRGIGRQAPESDAEFAERAGLGYEWLKKWMRRDDAPTDRERCAKLVAGLEVNDGWLLDNIGDAPEPSLWRRWWSERTRAAAGNRTPAKTKEQQEEQEQARDAAMKRRRRPA